MSRGSGHRRKPRVRAVVGVCADLLRVLAEAQTEDATLVAAAYGREVWAKGDVLFGMPSLPDHLGVELKEALARRRTALLTGQCPCGGRMQLHTADPDRILIRHQPDCPAADGPISRLAAAELAQQEERLYGS